MATALATRSELTQELKDRLAELETVVDHGKENWLKVGAALAEIRREKLYLDTARTFQEYCETRFEFTREWACALMRGTRAIEDKSGGRKRNHGSGTTDTSGGRKSSRKSRKSTQKSESTGDGKSTDSDDFSDMLPELREHLKTGAVSPKLIPEIADLAPAQQQVFLDQVKEEGENPRAALAVAKQAPAEADDKPEPVLDAEGEEVPSQAIAAFAVAKELESIGREIDKIIHKVEEFSKGPGGRLVRFDSFKQQMRDAKGNLHANRATHVCGYCHGKNAKCECCKGEGWVAKHIWEQTPGCGRHTENGKAKQ